MLGHTLPVCSSSLYFPHSPVQGALVTSLLGQEGGREADGPDQSTSILGQDLGPHPEASWEPQGI